MSAKSIVVAKDSTNGVSHLTLNITLDKEKAAELINFIKSLAVTKVQSQLGPLVQTTSHFQQPTPSSPKRSKNHKCSNCEKLTIKEMKEQCKSLGVVITGLSSKESICAKLFGENTGNVISTKVTSPKPLPSNFNMPTLNRSLPQMPLNRPVPQPSKPMSPLPASLANKFQGMKIAPPTASGSATATAEEDDEDSGDTDDSEEEEPQTDDDDDE